MNEENINPQTPPEEHNENTRFSTMSPISAAFIAMVGIFLLYQLGGAILTLLIFGFNFEKADVNALRMLTMGGQIMLMLLPTLIFARYVYQHNTSFILRIKFPSLKEIGIFGIGLILLTPLLQSFLYIQNYFLHYLSSVSPLVKNVTDLLDKLDKLVETTYGSLLTAHNVFEGSFIIFVVALIPAICEETLFRGLVQKSFEMKLKPVWAILITAIFFGLYHFNPYGLIALISLGVYFGFAAYISDSIFVPMVLHFFNNFVAVLVFFFLGNDELINTTVKKQTQIIPLLFSFAMFAVLFFAYIFYIKTNYHKFISNKKGGSDDLPKV